MLIVAHRLATIKDCDKIIVLDKGEIIEEGTHSELLNKQGQYYRLWEMQQGNFMNTVNDDEVEEDSIMEETDDEDILVYT